MSSNSIRTGIIRPVALLFLFAQADVLIAQDQAAIFGRVVDSGTKLPVSFASIFLASTMMGTNSNAEGRFRIDKVPPGKYDISISSVGYNLRQISVVVVSEPRELNIELTEDVKTLKEVVVKGTRSDPGRWMPEFKIYFIGLTPNTKDCTILNPDKIDFDYDEEARVLHVSSSEPIQVENKALGYRMNYLLQQFTLDFGQKKYLLVGIPRFEELKPRGGAQVRRWERQREATYNGSLTHFMRSLKAHRLEEDRFEIYSLCGKLRVRANPDSLFYNNSKSQLESHCPLEIVYKGDVVRQISRLTLLDGKLTVYDNGYYEDQFRLQVGGFYARRDKIAAEWLPMDYQPIPKKEKK